MKTATLHIDELRVRAAGLSPAQAQQLGELVARRLSEASFGPDRSRQLPSLVVHIRSRRGSSLERLADDILAGIRRSLA